MQAAFTSQGLTAPTGMDSHVIAAVDAWDALTGWTPYFQVNSSFSHTTDPATFVYDLPEFSGKILDLERPFTSVSTVKTNVSPTYAGDTQTLATDYRLLPLNYAVSGKPITKIQFVNVPYGGLGSIEVTGVYGIAEIPDDVWLAVRDYAMKSAILEIIQGISTASELTQGPIKLKFDNEEGRSKIDRWTSQFVSVARRHMRITL